MTYPNILIVEDEAKIAALLSDYFKTENFNVFIISRGDRVLGFMDQQPLDLILLDIMLPGMDGKKI
ncbi:MAG: response regulator, partial [Proteobacteria bacterium]|nr:response regulator [Pseudomonadota bacterium]